MRTEEASITIAWLPNDVGAAEGARVGARWSAGDTARPDASAFEATSSFFAKLSTTGLQNELSTGANITIEGDEIFCDLTAGTNIDITNGVISTTGLQNELSTGANITIEGDEISCDLVGSTSIDITNGVISTTGLATTTQLDTKQDEITTDTDLILNSITSNDLIVNETFNVDDVLTYENTKYLTPSSLEDLILHLVVLVLIYNVITRITMLGK